MATIETILPEAGHVTIDLDEDSGFYTVMNTDGDLIDLSEAEQKSIKDTLVHHGLVDPNLPLTLDNGLDSLEVEGEDGDEEEE